MNQKLSMDLSILKEFVAELSAEIKVEDNDNDTLARALILLNQIADLAEEKGKVIKESLLKRNIEPIFDLDTKKKVYISEGKTQKVFDIPTIFSKLPQEEFFSIINIVQNRIQNEETKKIVDFYSKSEKGNPYLTVAKFSKEDEKKLLS